jgi:hypothetical protein
MALLESLTQKILLQAEATAPVLGGLDATIERLKTIEGYGVKIRKAFADAQDVMVRRTSAQFQAEIKTQGLQSADQLAKIFGFTPEKVRAYGQQIEAAARESVRKIQKQMEGMISTTPKGRISKEYQRHVQELEAAQSKLCFGITCLWSRGGGRRAISPVGWPNLPEHVPSKVRRDFGRARIPTAPHPGFDARRVSVHHH